MLAEILGIIKIAIPLGIDVINLITKAEEANASGASEDDPAWADVRAEINTIRAAIHDTSKDVTVVEGTGTDVT
jgi:hypothetical protein